MVHSFAAAVRMFLLGVPRLGVAGTEVWTGVCWGSGSSRNPSSGIPADHEGAAPSQADQLLLLHCFTAGVGGGNLVVIFFFSFLFFF